MSGTPFKRYDTKKLNQTKISSYFTECVKRISSIPAESAKQSPSRRKKTSRSRKKLSFTTSNTTTNKEETRDFERQSLHTKMRDDMSLLITGIPKRKLPAPIFSDDEESENDLGIINSPKKRTKDESTKQIISLNKPSPSNSPQKKIVNSSPPKTSNLSTSPLSNRLNVGASSSATTGTEDTSADTRQKGIRVLQDLVIHSPKKSPQKEPVKDETKKLNYEQLRVFREFFVNILKQQHLESLLSSTDKELLLKFFNADKNYQYLCVKLFLWKPIWYNIFKYVEKIGLTMNDSQITLMYDYLKDNGFVDVDYIGEDLFDLLDLLSLKDLRDIGRSFRFPNVSGPKDSIIARLIKNSKTQVTLTSKMNAEDVLRKRIKEKMGFCVKLSADLNRCLYFVYLLNTFSNSSLLDPHDYFRDVSYFNVVFPTCNIENFHIFYTTQEFSRFADAVKLRSELENVVEKRNLNHIFEICRCAYNMLKQLNDEFGMSFDTSHRPPHLERFTPNAQYIYILSSGSKHITTTYYDHVMNWYEYLISQKYCSHKRGEWYAHLLLIYTTYTKNYERAAKLLINALKEEKDHFSDIQLQELAHRGKMLNRKSYNLPPLYHDEIASLSPPSCDRIWPQDIIECKSMTGQDPGRKRMYAHQCENGDINYLTVEQTAQQYYRTIGFPNGEHCEGSLIIASFCLLFWDIIYESYVKGTFVSNVQNAPLDMYSSHFYKNREQVINKRLDAIKEKWKEEVFKKKFSDNWNLHSHETSLCLIDSVVDKPEYLYDVIMCIGRPILAKIFERLVKNFKFYHSGFPDLIVWNLQEKRAKFVEVKSENDKLSIKQKLWLNYLIDIGANVAVCHVEPKSSKKKLRSTAKGSSKKV